MNKSALRFDAREIAVIFTLFVFVSLLMFTVGIMVGKGLTQARYEGKLQLSPTKSLEPLVKTYPESNSGSSVSINAPKEKEAEHAPAAKEENHAKSEAVTAPTTKTEAPIAAPTASATETQKEPLKLIPLRPSPAQAAGTNLSDPSQETEALMKNPKIRSLVESDSGEETRSPAAIEPAATPMGGKGAYTIQVGSYPDETAARERVDALKKMGFPQAFFSAKELGAANGTWFRVWLGHYNDYATAKKMGDQLQARGEVKNYIVRKAN